MQAEEGEMTDAFVVTLLITTAILVLIARRW